MDYYKENWLPHLKSAIPKKALGNNMSMYTIALEGWRRGLIVKFQHTFNKSEKRIRLTYSLSYKGKTHKFSVSRGDRVKKEAINVCINKDVTKDILLKADVAIPMGKGFDSTASDEEIINYAKSLNTSLVLKPTDGLSGRGVVVDIKNIQDFKKALNYVRNELNYKSVVVEAYVQGVDYRVYVINNKVIGAVTRIPANITGDGKSNIKQLILRKNKIRDNNPNHNNRKINIDDELIEYIEKMGFSLDSIPNKGERVFLKKTSNISSGGEPIDVTDDLTIRIRENALKAARAIPGLDQCSVDMLIDQGNNGYVIEVNSKPQIGLHLFPEEGKARDIPKEIVDYYFPETKDIKKNSSFYFDFDGFIQILNSGAAKEVTVKKIPSYQPIVKGFRLHGNVESSWYQYWIEKKAHGLRLSGYIKKAEDEEKTIDIIVAEKTIDIIVAGKKENINEFKKIITTDNHQKSKIKSLIEFDCEEPIKMGFEIIGKSNTDYEMKIKELTEQNNKLKKEIKARNSSNILKKILKKFR